MDCYNFSEFDRYAFYRFAQPLRFRIKGYREAIQEAFDTGCGNCKNVYFFFRTADYKKVYGFNRITRRQEEVWNK